MSERLDEILHITQEECAEVTQAISKVFRFGFTETYNGKTNKEHLEEEIGDLLAMVRLLYSEGAIDESVVERACIAKLTKLDKWSKHIRLTVNLGEK